MALILSIDTATEHAIVSLANAYHILASEENEEPMNHASFVQPAIARILSKSNLKLSEIDAVAVSAGPGSYTGLRVGLSSAKGLCFALNKPLIVLNTLQIMAQQAALQIGKNEALYCPMIDARRMEVFAALFNFSLNEIQKTSALILTDESIADTFSQEGKETIFFGSGAKKWEAIAPKRNFTFYHEKLNASQAINLLAQQCFREQSFADLAYSEPLYSKSFYTTAKINDVL
ncbi:MAG TPA: tRNA (adenosine(37)-N6)-threonylcarbamoyltransferase complex dimerization subunit type 1 TsaB [Arachidicoccus sp.]